MNEKTLEFTVLLFAGLRQRAGRSSVVVELPPSATVADLLVALAERFPEIAPGLPTSRVAVDHRFADPDDTLPATAEIAVIPPVSGGHDGPDGRKGHEKAGEAVDVALGRVRLRSAPLDLADVVAAVEHRDAGGITTFTGNVREHSRGKVVDHLEYEAYPPMAVKVMASIAADIEAEIEGARVAIHHRVGHLVVGDTAVVIAASAPHRAEAFAACREAIERLKRDVPIWKKEVDQRGEAWIGQGP